MNIANRIKIFLAISITLVSVGFWNHAISNAFAQNTPSINLSTRLTHYLDGKIEAVDPQRQFGCGERIFAAIELPGLQPGKQDISIQWFGPKGKLENQQNFRFSTANRNQTENKPTYLSSFIEFQSSGGLTSIFDPSAGLDGFIGDWKIVVVNHNETLFSQTFSIIC